MHTKMIAKIFSPVRFYCKACSIMPHLLARILMKFGSTGSRCGLSLSLSLSLSYSLSCTLYRSLFAPAPSESLSSKRHSLPADTEYRKAGSGKCAGSRAIKYCDLVLTHCLSFSYFAFSLSLTHSLSHSYLRPDVCIFDNNRKAAIIA